MANPLEASLRLRDEFTKVLTKIDNQLQKTTSTMETFKRKIGGQSEAFNALAQAAQTAVAKMNSAFQRGFSAVQNLVKSSIERIISLLGGFGNRIKSSLNLDPTFNKIAQSFSKVTSALKSGVSSISNTLKGFGAKVATTLNLDKAFSSITKGFDALKSKSQTAFNAIASSFSNAFKSKKVRALDDVTKQLDALNRKKANISINVKSAESAQKRLETLDTVISKLSKRRADIKAQTSGVEQATAQLDNISSKINRLNGVRAQVQVEADKVTGAKKALADVQSQIGALNKQKAELSLGTSGFMSALRNASSAFSSFRSSVSNGLQNMNNAFKNFSSNISSAFSHLSSAGSQVQSVFGGIMSALGITAALSAIKSGVVGLTSELNGNSMAWQTFQGNMAMLGTGQGEIDKTKKSLQEFAQQTIYSASDMASTYSQMAAIGVDNTESIVKGMAGLASSAQDPQQAMKTMSQQMVQALSKPELQWMDFKLMMEQAPAGMAQVAKQMGYGLDDFILAIQNGEIASSEFGEAVAAVGTNADFSKMATEFKTVGQAMDGLREGLANKLEPAFAVLNSTGIRAVGALNDAMGNIDFGSLADKLQAFADTLDFDQMIKDVTDFAQTAYDKVQLFLDGFNSTGALDKFSDAVSAVWDALKNVAENIDYQAIGKMAGDFVGKISDIAKAIGDFVAKVDPDAISKISVAVAGLAGAFAVFKAGKGLFGIGKGLANVGGAFGQLIGDLFGGKSKKVKGNPLDEMMPDSKMGGKGLGLMDSLSSTASQFAKGAKNIALIYGVIKLIEELAQAMQDVNSKVPADLGKLAPKLSNMAIALTGMGAFVALAGKLYKTDFASAVKGLAVIAGISGNLMLAAEAMQQINEKVTGDFGGFASKLANLALGVSSMGALVVVAGKLASTDPASAIAGLATVALISLELMLAAEAMQQVNDKVSSNIGDFASKVANIAIAIGAMTALVQVVGTLTALNPIGAVAGLATVALIAGELMLVAEALQQVNDKVPSDTAGLVSKITGIKDVIAVIADTSFTEILGSIGGAINFSAAISALNSVADMIEPLQALSALRLQVGVVKQRIKDIKDVIADLSVDSFGDILSNVLGYQSFDSAVESVGALRNVALLLMQLGAIEVDHTSARAMINQIRLTLQAISVDSLGEAVSNLLGYESFSSAITSVDALKRVAQKLGELATIEVDHASARAMVNQIRLTLQNISVETLGEAVTNLLGYDDFSTAVTSVDALKQVAVKLGELANVEIDHAASRAMVNQLRLTLSNLSRETFGEFIANLLGFDDFTGAISSVEALKQVAVKLNELSLIEIDHASARAMVNQLRLTLSNLSRDTFGEFMQNLLGYEDFSGAVTAIDSLVSIAGKLVTLSNIQVDSEAVSSKISAIRTAISQLNDLPTVSTEGATGVQEIITAVIDLATRINQLSSSAQASASGVVSAFSQIGQSAVVMRNQMTSAMNGMTAVVTSGMARVRASAVTGMAGFNASIASGMATSASTARSGSTQIVSAFSGLRGQLYSAGAFSMSGLTAGITAGAGSAIAAARSVANSISSTIRNALDIHSPSRVTEAIGAYVSAGLAKGIEGAGKLVAKASESVAGLAVPNLPDMSQVGYQFSYAGLTPATDALTATRTITDVYDNAYSGSADQARTVSINTSDIEDLSASLSQTIKVHTKQVSPQITINIEGADAQNIDEDEIIRRIEEIIIEANDDDLT